MKKLLAGLLFALPFTVQADFMEVLEVDLKDDCSFAQYMEIMAEFNAWAEPWNYQAEIAVPLHAHDLTSLYWMGRTEDAETFGKAWDAWRDGLRDPDSKPAKLNDRFAKCVDTLNRSSYDVY